MTIPGGVTFVARSAPGRLVTGFPPFAGMTVGGIGGNVGGCFSGKDAGCDGGYVQREGHFAICGKDFVIITDMTLLIPNDAVMPNDVRYAQ
jgi:hypothetical protein